MESSKPKIVHTVNFTAIDDQRDVWLPAMHTISVKDGFYPSPMVKSNDLDEYSYLSSSPILPQIGVKADGTVWLIESDSSEEERMDISVRVSCAFRQKRRDRMAMGLIRHRNAGSWSKTA